MTRVLVTGGAGFIGSLHMMTRRQFELIAQAVHDADLDYNSWRALMDELIPALHTQNSRFNSARFIESSRKDDATSSARRMLGA